MAIIERRKPFKVGRSRAIAIPKTWTTSRDEVIIVLNRVGLIIPKEIDKAEIRQDVEKVLRELEKYLEDVEVDEV
jgi:hypothetical protein